MNIYIYIYIYKENTLHRVWMNMSIWRCNCIMISSILLEFIETHKTIAKYSLNCHIANRLRHLQMSIFIWQINSYSFNLQKFIYAFSDCYYDNHKKIDILLHFVIIDIFAPLIYILFVYEKKILPCNRQICMNSSWVPHKSYFLQLILF